MFTHPSGQRSLLRTSRSRRRRHVLEMLEARQMLAADPLDLSGVEWRTIDGTNNNAAAPDQGAAETRQIRFGYGAQFPDGFGDAIIVEPQRANPRTISNVLHAQEGDVLSERHLTDWIFQWGQFITHDMDLTHTGPEFDELFAGGTGDFSIPVLDPNDPLGPNPIPFHRSEYDPLTGTPDPFPGTTRLNRREVMNSVTSYIDASMVYGSDDERAAALRTFEGGKLQTGAFGLLPTNDNGLPNEDALGVGNALFLAGDVRANEQIGLTAVHTLFLREHNRLADAIADVYPELNDEEIYQFARRIVGAEMQIITYEEYLPAMLGFDLAPKPEDAVYDPEVNAAITNSFAHAVFRFGHSQISEETLLVNNRDNVVGSVSIREAFFNPDILKDNPANVGRLLKGLASQTAQENDLLLVDGVRNNLFGPPGAGGLDLGALDIQRGRDHGLPDYNTLRNAYGIGRVTSFAEITSDPVVQQQLEDLFGTVDNIDPFVGALAEDHVPGSSAGPFIHAVVGNQFERLRDGDRFFYTQDAFLQSETVGRVIDLEEISLANIIRWNTGISNIQDNVFFEDSVLIFEAPDEGANVSLVAGLGVLTIVDNNNGEILGLYSLRDIEQVILVGSAMSNDVFNLFVSNARGGIEDGIEVYGGGSSGDILRIYGGLRHDDFEVGEGTASVNANDIVFSGIETLGIATLTGRDDVEIADGLSFEVLTQLWFNPLDD